MLKGLLLAAALLPLLVSCSKDSGGGAAVTTPTVTAAPSLPAAAVPDRYREAFVQNQAALSEFAKTLQSPPRGRVANVSTSLLVANANRGPALLTAQNLEATRPFLQRYRDAGFGAIELQVSFPLLSPNFPNSDRYAAYYSQVVDMAHGLGMKVLVETGPIFANSEYTDLKVDFAGLSLQQYFEGRTAAIVRTAREIRPDYIAIGHEPANERDFAGQRFTNQQYADFVNATVAAVRALGTTDGGVKLGVGTGTWEEGLYDVLVAQTDVDFHDIHVYPIVGRGLEIARRMAQKAAARGRDVIIGESWLYKVTTTEQASLTGATSAEAYRRDAYSFWAPLDLEFVRTMLALGAEFSSPLVSLWGASFAFWGTLEWTPALDALSYRQTMERLNQSVYQNVREGVMTPLGAAASEAIRNR